MMKWASQMEGKQALHGPDQGVSPRENSRLRKQHVIIYCGFESVERYIAKPTIVEALFCYRRTPCSLGHSFIVRQNHYSAAASRKPSRTA